MPRRRRKRRPPLRDREKPGSPFFVKTKTLKPDEPVQEQTSAEASPLPDIQTLQTEATHLLDRLCTAICSSQPEEKATNQSKALELANQMLASDIWHIADIHSALSTIRDSLTENTFICGTHIHKSYGQGGTSIDLGYSFHQLNAAHKLRVLLRAAVKTAGMPELYGMPVGRYENVDRAEAWTDYICTLLELLPERPYLITGTPTNTLPPPELGGEENGNEGDDEADDLSINAVPAPASAERPKLDTTAANNTSKRRGLFDRFRNLFSRT